MTAISCRWREPTRTVLAPTGPGTQKCSWSLYWLIDLTKRGPGFDNRFFDVFENSTLKKTWSRSYIFKIVTIDIRREINKENGFKYEIKKAKILTSTICIVITTRTLYLTRGSKARPVT